MMNNHYFRLPRFAFMIALLFWTCMVCSAQAPNKFALQGVFELGGNISYQHTSVINQGDEQYAYHDLSVSPYFGYFITDNLEIGINPLGIQKRWNTQEHLTLIKMLLTPAYNFRAADNVFPFIEAQGGYTAEINSFSVQALNTSSSGFSWGGRVGVKFVIAGSCLLNGGVQYQQLSFSHRAEPRRSGSNTLMFSTGFTFWL